MGMAAKKERGRFSLRFNIGDPVQRAAVELLELQPPHSKSQYIANAITYYNANFADDPQPLKAMAPVIYRSAIEAIVREFMRQETDKPKSLLLPRASAEWKKGKRLRHPMYRRRSQSIYRKWEKRRRLMM